MSSGAAESRLRRAWEALLSGSDAKVPALVFCVALLLYAVSPNVTNTDSYLTFPTAVSIVHSGDLTLDEFNSRLVKTHHGYIELKGQHYDVYPWPTALLFVPVVVALDAAHSIGVGPGASRAVESDSMGAYQLGVASLVTAVAAMLVTLIALDRSQLRGRPRKLVALMIGLSFALGTSSWSTASRALWQHGPSIALLAGALVLAGRAASHPRGELLVAVGALAGASFVVRPTNAVVLIGLAAWSVTLGLRWLVRLLFGAAVVLGPWMIVNVSSFGSWWPPYYSGGRLALRSRFPEFVLANLVSPSRGLFVFAPITLAAVFGFVIGVKRGYDDSLFYVSAAMVIMYLLIVSAGREAWWAGHSIGPRFMTDPLPMMALLAVPAADRLIGPEGHVRITQPVALVAAIALAWSVAVNGGAAVMRSTNCWNVDPTDVNLDPDRVWSLAHPQVVYGFETLIEKGPSAALLGTCHVPTGGPQPTFVP